MTRKQVLIPALLIIFLSSSYITKIFIKSILQFLPSIGCMLLAMVFVGILYYAFPKMGESMLTIFVVIMLMTFSLLSSVGGMKQYFFKSQQMEKRNQKNDSLYQTGKDLIYAQQDLGKQNKGYWANYNVEQNKAKIFSSLMKINEATITDDNMSSIYLLTVQTNKLTGMEPIHVELILMLLFALCLDGIGIYCSSEIQSSENKRPTKKGIIQNLLAGFSKEKQISFLAYSKSLWQGVNKKYWQTQSLKSQSDINISRRLEKIYRAHLEKLGLIRIEGGRTYSETDYISFINKASQQTSEHSHENEDN